MMHQIIIILPLPVLVQISLKSQKKNHSNDNSSSKDSSDGNNNNNNNIYNNNHKINKNKNEKSVNNKKKKKHNNKYKKNSCNYYFCQKHFLEDIENLCFNYNFYNSLYGKLELLLYIDKRKNEYSLKCNCNVIKEMISNKLKFRKEFNYQKLKSFRLKLLSLINKNN